MTRSELLNWVPWSAAFGAAALATAFGQLTHFTEGSEIATVPLITLLGPIGAAVFFASPRDTPVTLSDSAKSWLEFAGMTAIIGTFYGLIASLPVVLVFSMMLALAPDVDASTNTVMNLAAVGALIPPAIRYWRLPESAPPSSDLPS